MLALYLRRQCCNSKSLVRCISSSYDNLTSHMGLENNFSNSRKRAVILDSHTVLSYSDLAKRVASYVSLLHGKYTLMRGHRLLARVDKTIDSLALYLAVVRLGAIYIPLNPAYTSKETEHFVKDSEPRVFITCNKEADAKFAEYVRHVVDTSTISKEAQKARPDYGIESVQPNDVACICYTSGTTGLPKGAMLTHGNLMWNAESLIDAWRFTSSDILLHYLPFYHVHGMFISLNCSLFTRSAIIFRPKFDVDDALKWIPSSTVMMGVPTYYNRLMQRREFDSKLTRNMRLFVCGSAPLSLALWKDFQQRTGHAILERYGMTEAAVITSNAYEEEERIPGSVGKILRGGKMRISDSGVVEIKIPSLFRGYWNNPEKTKLEFTPDRYFITGDIGKIDDTGYLWLLGRDKDVIISGGLNVYPKEVEDAVDSLHRIHESAVIGVPHDDLGEAVVAVCVLADKKADAEQLKAQMAEELSVKLANYKRPKEVIFVDSLPRNSMGKVQKNLLREQYKQLFQ